jgi:hypothetical protein
MMSRKCLGAGKSIQVMPKDLARKKIAKMAHGRIADERGQRIEFLQTEKLTG